MSYIVEYTTLSGKRIPITHKIFETAEAAEQFGNSGVRDGNYRSYTVVNQQINENDELPEGYKTLPNIDRERYSERPGLEGPFQTMAGKVVYYDPKEGAYYDPDTDMYMSYDEFRALDNDYSGMRDPRDIPVKEAITLDYSRYMRSHGKKPRVTGPGLFMFTTKDMGEPDKDDVFQFQGNWNDAKRAAAKWAKSKGALRFYMMENTVNNRPVVKENEEPVKFNGRTFNDYKRFSSKDRANQFLEKNEAYGVIGEKDGYVYVAKNADLGMKDLDEAAAKIACVKCDEVSTAKAWEKNRGFCPKCKTSNQGVAESINEADTSYEKDMDNNKAVIVSGVKGMKSTPFRKKFKNMAAYDRWSDSDAAGDYDVQRIMNEGLSDDAHHMERDHEVQMARSQLYKTANYAIKLHSILKGISEEQGLEGWMQAKITKAADYLGSVFHALEYDQLERLQSEPMPAIESVNETTSAGAVASVPMPMGKMIKRKKK